MPPKSSYFVSLWLLITLTACQADAQNPLPSASPSSQPPAATRTPRPSITPLPPPTRRATLSLPADETPLPATVTPSYNPSGEQVSIQTRDGLELVGYYYIAPQPNSPVVILMHQFQSSQAQVWPLSDLIPWLQNLPVRGANQPEATPSAQGQLPLMPSNLHFNVLTFDFRGHGQSPGPALTELSAEAQHGYLLDAQAAYAYAASLPYADSNRIIGIGTSIGADAAVDACEKGCLGVFGISPGNYLGLSWQSNAYRVTNAGKPVRCMYSYNDTPALLACTSLEENAFYKLSVAEGKKHGQDFLIPRKMEADFGQTLLEFLQAAVGH